MAVTSALVGQVIVSYTMNISRFFFLFFFFCKKYNSEFKDPSLFDLDSAPPRDLIRCRSSGHSIVYTTPKFKTRSLKFENALYISCKIQPRDFDVRCSYMCMLTSCVKALVVFTGQEPRRT